MMKKPLKTVDEYIKAAPLAVQPKLRELRRIVKKAAPQAEEKISYSMPYYGYKGRLLYFAVYKSHIGLYILPGAIKKFAKELTTYQTSKGTVQLQLGKPLPAALIKRMIIYRVKENESKAKNRKNTK